MDTVAIIPRKKITLIRANPKQLTSLLNAFATSGSPSSQQLKSLNEETGLPYKWIVSWFSRQRRKAQKDITPSSDSAMSPEEIAGFKTEHHDLVLESSSDAGAHTKVQKKRLKPKRGPGRPRVPQVTTEQCDEQAISKSKQEKPKPQAMQPLILPATSSHSYVPDASQCSSFVLRPLAPRMYMHPGSQQSTVSNVPTLPRPTNFVAKPEFHVLNYNYTDAIQPQTIPQTTTSIQPVTAPTTQYQLYTRPLQPAAHIKTTAQDPLQVSHQNFQFRGQPLHPSTIYPINTLSVFTPARGSAYHQPSLQHWPLHTQSLTTIHDESNKENQYPPAPPPFLSNTSDSEFEAMLQHYCSPPCDPLDPSTTPLKHLTLFKPFETHHTATGTSALLDPHNVMESLLDSTLADEDPFQATMGLVFLSRLGLDWE